MRNLVQYPITSADIFDAITTSENLISGMNTIGDVNCYSLSLLKLYLEENIDSVNVFLNEHKMLK